MTNTWSPPKEGKLAVTLSSAALMHLKNQIAKRGSGIGMRLGVKKTGCSGYAYQVEVIDHTHTDDEIFLLEDSLVVAVDRQSYPFVCGTQVDYLKQGLSARFVFQNPNEKSSCGCGESFTIEDPI